MNEHVLRRVLLRAAVGLRLSVRLFVCLCVRPCAISDDQQYRSVLMSL